MTRGDSLDFYVTAATVLPLLLGLIVFELRASVLRAEAPSPRSVSGYVQVAAPVLVVALLVTGEVAAVYALAEGQGSDDSRRAVMTALFGGGLVLVLSIVEVIFRPIASRRETRVEVCRNVVLIAVIAVWLLATPG